MPQPPGDLGAMEAHHDTLRAESAGQRDRFGSIQARLVATLQLDSITIAVFIALVLIGANDGGLAVAAEISVAIGVGLVIGSAVCAVAGLLLPVQLGLTGLASSERAALRLNRAEYLWWRSSEMRRFYNASERRLHRKNQRATIALILAALGITLAGATIVAVIVS